MIPAYVGITDYDWYEYLSSQPGLEEVNFWKPAGSSHFRSLGPGGPFLFKRYDPYHAIVGGGYFGYSSRIAPHPPRKPSGQILRADARGDAGANRQIQA